MKVEGMTEDDLNGLLFASFPPEMPLSECRDSLEMLVAEAWDEDYADAEDEEECVPMALTPYWAWRALCVKARHEAERTTDAERESWREWWTAERERRRREMTGRTAGRGA